jgi:glycosyltransferase involved in cell wall biosynthesis
MPGALVHEWIAQSGGSENVLQAFADLYPEADIYCLWNDSVGRFDHNRVAETWLARTPLRGSKALALPFMPHTWRRLEAKRDYDWALISSHLFAHHARFRDATPTRYVYVHSPARYIWTPDLDRRGASLPVRAAGAALKPLDRARAKETEHFAANSDFVRRRVEDSWHVPAVVIHPPVEVRGIQSVVDWAERLTPEELAILEALPDGFVLGASRFIPYKRLDRAIRVGELTGRSVVLAGDGPLLGELTEQGAQSSADVRMVVAPSSQLLYALYQRCAVYVFPPVEDFGIMPVEAMAAGAPVIANRVGGAAESVIEGGTGALADFESDAELAAAFERAIGTERSARTARALDFDRSRFDERIRRWIGV